MTIKKILITQELDKATLDIDKCKTIITQFEDFEEVHNMNNKGEL